MNQSRKDVDLGGGGATRAELVASARHLFARHGFDGASVRAITRGAGANLGAVTYHFGSKRALYGAVLEEGLAPIADRVEAVAGARGSARDRMLLVVEAYFDHFEEHPDLPRLLLQEVAAGKEPPEVVRRIVSTILHTLVAIQREGLEDGTVHQGHPVLTALSVVSQPIYLTLVAPMVASIGGVDLHDARVRSEATRHVVDFVEAGLRPRIEGEEA